MTKGIILAGGSGTRLYPLTKVISKQLMPIYNKPMIYYPLANLISAGIKDIMIITTPHDQILFKDLLGDGKDLGVNLFYEVQSKPNGIAESFIIAEKFIDDTGCCLILGDNLFYGHDIQSQMNEAINNLAHNNATIFGYNVNEPERYGVAELNEQMQIINIVEKPEIPKSNYAITGLYFFPSDVVAKAKNLVPSARNEIEITDLNKIYLNENRLNFKILENGAAWLDTGTHDSMLRAAEFVKIIEERQNLLIGSIEYEALLQNFISEQQFIELAKKNGSSEYGKKLLAVKNVRSH